MYDFFVSHSGTDTIWVSKLVNRVASHDFQGRKLRVWYDENDLKPGDYILRSIEVAIEESRFIGLVLTPQAVESEWVQLERVIVQSADPASKQKKIIPLLLKDCKIPAAIKPIKYIDFREPQSFEKGLSQLLAVLCQPEMDRAEEIYEKTKKMVEIALQSQIREGRICPTLEKDALYSFIADIDVDDVETEGLAMKAFDAMIDMNKYDATLIASECLAALSTKSITYDRIAQRWYMRSGWAGPMAAVRAYSKIAEINPNAVDTSGLLHCSMRLDEKIQHSGEEMSLMFHIARAVGKIKNTEQGQDLIETLGLNGAISRQVAAVAIGFDMAKAGPIYHLSVMRDMKKSLTNKPPTARLLNVLAALSTDDHPEVQLRVRESESQIKNSWPDLNYPSRFKVTKSIRHVMPTSVIRITDYNFGLPFSGKFLRVTESNWQKESQRLARGTVVFIDYVPEVHFLGASGLLFYHGGGFGATHQCTRVMASGTPFAELMKPPDIPDGTFVVVDHNGLRIGKMLFKSDN